MDFLVIQNAGLYCVSAFALGFAGSFHCVGMCGPIALALAARGDGHGKSWRWRFAAGRFLYNAGRATTYAALGGVLGASRLLLPLHRYQEALSIGVGIGILFFAFAPFLLRRKIGSGSEKKLGFMARAFGHLRRMMGTLLGSPSWSRHYGLGVLNGFLPCGFAYLGLASAALLPGYREAALFMFCFGLGTMPAMLALAFAGQVLSQNVRVALRRFMPVGAALLAALFIARGLALDIPYVSPRLSAPAAVERCAPR